MKCSKCGKELPEDALFCNMCGCKVESIEDVGTTSSQESFDADIAQENTPTPESVREDVANDSNEKPKKKDRTIIYALLIFCAIILCIKGYTVYLNNQNSALIEKYARERYGQDYNSNKSTSTNSSDELEDSKEEKVRKEMEEAAEDYNKELPEDIGFGLTMKKCEIEGKNMVYTIEWDGVEPDEFTDDEINDIKTSMAESLQEEDSPALKLMKNQMKEYGYKIAYRFVNENGEKLFEFALSPDNNN